MISIQGPFQRRDQSRDSRDPTLECYLAAIKNMSQYAVELDEAFTAPHRRYLMALAVELEGAAPGALLESRSTVRGLLRDYRDKAAQYLNGLREQLASTAAALQQTVEALSQSDGTHADKLQSALSGLRAVAETPEGHAVRGTISSAAGCIEESLAKIRQQQQFTISQLQSEIRTLHSRIDSLENAAAIDQTTKFSSRRSIEEYIRSLSTTGYSVLLFKLRGLAQARAKFGQEIADDLVAVFARRLRNSVPKEAVPGRWSDQDFLAILPGSRSQDAAAAGPIADHLSMPYACMMGGKTVRISLEVSAEFLPGVAADVPDKVLERLDAAFR